MIKKFLLFSATLHALFTLTCAASAIRSSALKHPLDEHPGEVTGPYRDAILKVIKTWPSKRLPLPKDPTAVDLTAYLPLNEKEHPHAIGVGQAMLVQAPIETVKKVLTDFAHYKDVFFTFEDVRILEVDGNRAVTEWDQKIPLPFVPNTVYSSYFYTDDRNPNRIFFRYQMKKSSDLKYSDGLMVLDKLDEKTTHYTEYDFYDANWGIAASVAPARIWTDSLRDIYYSDVAIKLRAEHPDWDFKKIKEQTKENFKEHFHSGTSDEFECLKHKTLFAP